MARPSGMLSVSHLASTRYELSSGDNSMEIQKAQTLRFRTWLSLSEPAATCIHRSRQTFQ